MDEELEGVKSVKIDILILGMIKQLHAYATILNKFCTQIRKSWTHFNILECTIVSLQGPREKTV